MYPNPNSIIYPHNLYIVSVNYSVNILRKIVDLNSEKRVWTRLEPNNNNTFII